MNKLDEALVELHQNKRDAKKQSAFYDLFLNSSFFVPVFNDGEEDEQGTAPVIIEADGNDYLMLFSSLERLKGWSNDEETPYLEVPGHVLALNSAPPLHWAMNVGTEFSKQFHPAEIDWLRQSVELCNKAADAVESCSG